MLSWDEPTSAKTPLPATPSPRMPSMPLRMPAPASTLLDPAAVAGMVVAFRLPFCTHIALFTRPVPVPANRLIYFLGRPLMLFPLNV